MDLSCRVFGDNMFQQKSWFFKAIAIIFSLVVLVSGCGNNPESALTQAKQALAEINSTSEPEQILGTVTLSETDSGLVVKGQFEQLPPGKHGFHIHEQGSCDNGGQAAGGHFNPDGVKHGYLPKDGFTDAHAGDLGNITIAEEGTGTYEETISGLTLTGGKYAVNNLSFIIHAQEDDFGQPTGNAGGRIGCGIIELSQ